jgi:predicted nucleic acid-binding protein
MAKIFLDTNAFLDILTSRSPRSVVDYDGHNIYISALTIHIALYVLKIKIPNREIGEILSNFELVGLTNEITLKALEGPTVDFEDNIQLHSAAAEECKYLITADKSLLKMKFFGVTRMVASMGIE